MFLTAVLIPTVCAATPKKCVSKTITIAVIDTGFGLNGAQYKAKLCKFGHRNFSKNEEVSTAYGTVDPIPVDHHSHGTNIVGLIDKYARGSGSDYCMVILKYYDPQQAGSNNLKSTIEAIKYATNIHADFINYSGGGTGYSAPEKEAVEIFLDQGGRFVAAAGNEASDLKTHPYYPATYDSRIVVVGNKNIYEYRSPTSNYGTRVDRWEYGENAEGLGIILSGTSQATAIATGKLVLETKNVCK